MLDESLSLRIAAIFIIATCSLLGVLTPFIINYYDSSENKVESAAMKCMKACAAGVLLGIAEMHLHADAQEDLSIVCPHYDLSYAVVSFGIILNLCIEQAVIIYIQSPSIKISYIVTNEVGCQQCEDKIREFQSDTCSISNEQDAASVADNDRDKEEVEKDLFSSLVKSDGLRTLVALYSMEISISIHSLIIGGGIGLLSGRSNLGALIPLIIAISFHQFVEGLGLGTSILQAKQSIGSSKIISFIVIFTLACPIGIIGGIGTSSQPPSSDKQFAKGMLDALAAGSLLYISLVEMIAEYFTATDLIKRPKLKIMMLMSFSFGVIALAVLAIWA